jgi:hypothetical protein
MDKRRSLALVLFLCLAATVLVIFAHRHALTHATPCKAWSFVYSIDPDGAQTWLPLSQQSMRAWGKVEEGSILGAFVFLLGTDIDDAVLMLNSLRRAHGTHSPLYDVLIFHETTLRQADAVQLQLAYVGGRVRLFPIWLCLPPEGVGTPWDYSGYSYGYRHMCRWHALALFQHPALTPYRYIMRLDADSYFLQPWKRDPFRLAEAKDIIYGTLLWFPEHEYVFGDIYERFIHVYLNGTPVGHALQAVLPVYDTITHDRVARVFFNNFEVMQVAHFRSSQYRAYTQFIESTGLIYSTRLGDAVIRTIYVLQFVPPNRVFSFRDDVCYAHDVKIVPHLSSCYNLTE